jgi:dUTP pyrophosphatase
MQIKVVGNIPQYGRAGDAGADLIANEDIRIPAYGRALVATGTSVAIPDGYVGLIHPRSGLAAKEGVTVLNTPGTIDSGYRGEIKVILYNSTDRGYWVKTGDRIAQLVIQEFVTAQFEEVEKLDTTERGGMGFGSTGI